MNPDTLQLLKAYLGGAILLPLQVVGFIDFEMMFFGVVALVGVLYGLKLVKIYKIEKSLEDVRCADYFGQVKAATLGSSC